MDWQRDVDSLELATHWYLGEALEDSLSLPLPSNFGVLLYSMYTVNNTVVDVYVTAGFGLIGYLFFKLGYEPPPLLLGFVLGPMMEENFRRALFCCHVATSQPS